MLKINKPSIIILSFIFLGFAHLCFMRECKSFQGEVNSNNINVRTDSTVSSELICKVNKGDILEIIMEQYDWYKIKLPKTAPLFIKRDLIAFTDNKTAKVLKSNVNLRLKPDESSPILGKLNQEAVLQVLDDKKDWCKIEPVDNSFGWIHKSFVNKIAEAPKQKEEDNTVKESPSLTETITKEGIVRPKMIKHRASHKLITEDNSVFALIGNKAELDSFNYRKVRASGRLIQGTEIIEIEKIEAL
jgi:SH3-like domain-containing protein